MATRIFNTLCSNLVETKNAINAYLNTWEGHCFIDGNKAESEGLSQKTKASYANDAIVLKKEAEYYETVWATNCFDPAWYDPAQGIGGKSSADYCLESYTRYFMESKKASLLAGC